MYDEGLLKGTPLAGKLEGLQAQMFAELSKKADVYVDIVQLAQVIQQQNVVIAYQNRLLKQVQAEIAQLQAERAQLQAQNAQIQAERAQLQAERAQIQAETALLRKDLAYLQALLKISDEAAPLLRAYKERVASKAEQDQLAQLVARMSAFDVSGLSEKTVKAGNFLIANTRAACFALLKK